MSKPEENVSIPPDDDNEIVIIEDEPEVDREMINEMRRAYLEEARSQDTSE